MEPILLKKPGADWGPLLWKVFHTLAEWSDRRDIVYRWKHMMELASTTIPCEICRRHMQEYFRGNSIFVRSLETVVAPPPVRRFRGVMPPTVKGWTPAKGIEVQQAVRKGLWKFHNHVNRSTGATELTEEEAYALYQTVDRSTACKEIRETLKTLESIWKPHARSTYKEWMIELIALLALIESGSY